jgi:hypothetical protein
MGAIQPRKGWSLIATSPFVFLLFLFIGIFHRIFFVTQISQMTKKVSNPMKKDLSRQGELDAQTEVLCRRRITAA